jgi:hypothetical protein
MPHYTCAKCRLRLRVAGAPAELVGDLCPECGSLLEPAAALEGLIGFRTVTHADAAAAAVQTAPHQLTAARVDHFVARRAARLDRERGAAEPGRWREVNDPFAAAVALAAPEGYDR